MYDVAELLCFTPTSYFRVPMYLLTFIVCNCFFACHFLTEYFCPIACMYGPRTVCDALFLSGFLQRTFQRQFAIELWRWKYKEDSFSPSYGCYCLRIWARDSEMDNVSRWQTASASTTSRCALPEHNDPNHTVMLTRLLTPLKLLYVINKCSFLARNVCVVLNILTVLFDVDVWSDMCQWEWFRGTLLKLFTVHFVGVCKMK
jgi:hypothetical protein